MAGPATYCRNTLLKQLILCCIIACSGNNLMAQDIEKSIRDKPVTISGSVDLRGIGYSMNGIAARRTPFSYFINGNALVNFYGLAIPLSATISEQDRSVSQPFNQFGMSPTYKWITVHVGYRNIVFSPYTLAGYTMLGVGAELNPGKFRFGFMYGRLNRATALDTNRGTVQPYSFSRKGYALKLGYGTEKNFAEFSFLNARDDSSTVRKEIPDTLRTITPAANAVFGFRAIYTVYKKFFIEMDAGLSVYTYNIGSVIAVTDDIKTMNSYTSSIIPVNVSSQFNAAYSASIGYRAKNYSVKATFKHIDPEFQSMGAYFFNNDVESYCLSPAFNALKNRLRFSGSIGFQHDNLRKQKAAITSRIIGMANLSCDITSQLGLDANYVNFSANATPQIVSVNNKYLLAQTTHNLSFSPRYILAKEECTHVAVISYNYSTLVDLNKETSTYNNIKTNVLYLNYNLTFNKSALTATAGLNKTKNTLYTGDVNNYGLLLGVNKNLVNNKLHLATNNSFTRSDQYGGATILNFGISAGYDVNKHHRFSLRWNMISNIPDKKYLTSPAFTEQTCEVGYTLIF